MKHQLIATSLLSAALSLPAAVAFASSGPQGQPHGYEIMTQQERKEYHEQQKKERDQAQDKSLHDKAPEGSGKGTDVEHGAGGKGSDTDGMGHGSRQDY